MVKTGWLSAGALTLAAVLGMSGTVAAQKPKHKPHQIPQTDIPPAVAPAPDEEAAGEALLEQMTSRSSEGLVELVRADGTVSMDLEGRFMNVMVVSPKAEGGEAASCATSFEALKHAPVVSVPASRVPKIAKTTTVPRELK